jgi:preprotein translocase subunit SecD
MQVGLSLGCLLFLSLDSRAQAEREVSSPPLAPGRDTGRASRQPSFFEVQLIDADYPPRLNAPVPLGDEVRLDRLGNPHVVQRRVLFTGASVRHVTTERKGQAAVFRVELTDAASHRLANVIAENRGRRVAVSLDRQIVQIITVTMDLPQREIRFAVPVAAGKARLLAHQIEGRAEP